VAPAPAVHQLLNWTGNISQPNWNPLALASRGTITQKAGYAAARLSLADPLKLIIGARYTDWKSEGENDDREHKVTTPYAGLVYDINDTYSAYASYTEIFQPQTRATATTAISIRSMARATRWASRARGSTTA
jgi:outer membrane receptor for ferric coprogen and ferric-rhodotorulic acid